MKKSLLTLFVLVVSASAANAQAVSASGSAVPLAAPAAVTVAKVTGQVSIANVNQTVDNIKLELGTFVNGAFVASVNPGATKNLAGPFTMTNNSTNYTHQFNMALAAGNYVIRVTPTITKPPLLMGGNRRAVKIDPTNATVTVP